MATPQRPGWYPAPDGSGTEQWWNGASWSDAKRGAGGAAIPAPATPRPDPALNAPPAGYVPPLAPTPAPYPTFAGQAARPVTLKSSSPFIALVFGILGLIIFPPLGIVGIVLGATALRNPSTIGTQRKIAILGVVLGVIGVVWGAIQLILVIVALANSAEYAI